MGLGTGGGLLSGSVQKGNIVKNATNALINVAKKQNIYIYTSPLYSRRLPPRPAAGRATGDRRRVFAWRMRATAPRTRTAMRVWSAGVGTAPGTAMKFTIAANRINKTEKEGE